MGGIYEDLIKLARIYPSNAHITINREAARELWRLPDIGPTPFWFKE